MKITPHNITSWGEENSRILLWVGNIERFAYMYSGTSHQYNDRVATDERIFILPIPYKYFGVTRNSVGGEGQYFITRSSSSRCVDISVRTQLICPLVWVLSWLDRVLLSNLNCSVGTCLSFAWWRNYWNDCDDEPNGPLKVFLFHDEWEGWRGLLAP